MRSTWTYQRGAGLFVPAPTHYLVTPLSRQTIEALVRMAFPAYPGPGHRKTGRYCKYVDERGICLVTQRLRDSKFLAARRWHLHVRDGSLDCREIECSVEFCTKRPGSHRPIDRKDMLLLAAIFRHQLQRHGALLYARLLGLMPRARPCDRSHVPLSSLMWS